MTRLFSRFAPVHWLALYCLVVGVWSIIGVSDIGVWFFELFVGLAGLAILLFTARRFPFSNLLYVVFGVHFTILAIGAHYTYAGMPLFNWLRDTFDLSRNHFDRVGHFFQGFTPALVAREILMRRNQLKSGGMLGYLCISVAGGITAFWEILEAWIVMLFYKKEGQEWLGWQGDIWDAQWDMTMCFTGAILALLFLRKAHDRSMANVSRKA